MRTYTAKEMARIQSGRCEGCGACCRGMGDTIRLDPLDVHELCLHLQKTFADLLEEYVDLHVEEGVILPHLRMREEEAEPCVFLSDDGRCDIHPIRPGFCRLFPLGRDYDGETFRYFVVEGGCPMTDLSKVRIDKWLGIEEIEPYEKFVADWHYFVKDIKTSLQGASDPEERKRKNLTLLETFYATPFDPMRNFYLQFAMRLKRARRILEE